MEDGGEMKCRDCIYYDQPGIAVGGCTVDKKERIVVEADRNRCREYDPRALQKGEKWILN